VVQPRRVAGIEPQLQTVGVLLDRFGGDAGRLEANRLEGAAAETTPARARPFEERDQRAGCTRLVAEIKVVAVRIVEVDGLLDKRETELAAVEVDRTLRV